MRPLLRKFKNVEDNVDTLKLHESNYLLVREDEPQMADIVSVAVKMV